MGKFKPPDEVDDVNLIPLMNLFVTMIPMLLLTAAFYHIGMVSVSVPTQSEEESDVATGEASVTMNVQMTDEGYVLSASSGTLSEADLKALDLMIPKKGGQYDEQRLVAVLENVKRKYEKSDTIMLVPGKTTKYKEMISTMDAARNMEMVVKGRKRKIPLFPVVVVSSLAE